MHGKGQAAAANPLWSGVQYQLLVCEVEGQRRLRQGSLVVPPDNSSVVQISEGGCYNKASGGRNAMSHTNERGLV